MRTSVLLSILLLTAACATNPTDDFEVQVVQHDHEGIAPIDTGNDRISTMFHGVGLDITVENRSNTPWKVEGVAVSTVGPVPVEIKRRAERWDELLAPGEAKTFHKHWRAEAMVGFGQREIPLRVELYLIAPDGTRRAESFVR